MAHSGFGRNPESLTDQEMVDAELYYIISVWPALLAIGLPKLAVVDLLCRLFSPGRWTRYFLWWLAGWGIVNYTVESVFSTFQCIPVQALWDFRIQGAKCASWKIYSDFSWYTGGTSKTKTTPIVPSGDATSRCAAFC